MACKTILIGIIILICFLSERVHCKLDKIKFFLTNYEVAEITEVPLRTISIKIIDRARLERSWKVNAFGKEFIIDLTNYYPREDAEVLYVSKLKNTTSTFLDKSYVLHYGSVRKVENSYVLGFFNYRDSFRGYIITDEVYCVEPFESKGSVIIYRLKDVIVPGCAELVGEELDCAETKYFESWKPNRPPPKPKTSRYSLFFNKYLELYNKIMAEQNQTTTLSNIKRTDETTEKDARKEDKAHEASHHEGKSNHHHDEASHHEGKSNHHHDEASHHEGMSKHHHNEKNSKSPQKGKNKNKDNKSELDATKMKEEIEDDEDEKEEKETKTAFSKGKETHSHEKDSHSANDWDSFWMDLLCSYFDTKHKNHHDHHSRKIGKDKEYKAHDETNETHTSNRTENLPQKKVTSSVSGLIRDLLESICGNKTKHSEHKKGKEQDSDKIKTYENTEKDEEDEANALRKAGNQPRQKDSHNINDWNSEWMDSVSTDGTNHGDRRKEKKHDPDKRKKHKGTKDDEDEKNGSHTKDSGKEENNDSDDDDDDFFNLPEYVGSLEKKFDLKTNSRIFQAFLKNGIDLPDIALDSPLRNISNEKVNDDRKSSSFHFNENKEYQEKAENEEEMNLNIEAVQEGVDELQCDVEIIIGTSFTKKFESHEDVIKDIFTQITLLNKIFRKVNFQRKAMPFHLTIRVAAIIIYGDGVYNPFTSDGRLEYFTAKYQGIEKRCFYIGFVNNFLQSGQFFDGYIPSSGGGACASFGNTLLVSHGSEDTPTPMALFFTSLMRGITRGMGANDDIADCRQGTNPNPMMVLQDYLLAKEITPKREISFFSQCNIDEMSVVFSSRNCFKKLVDPLCGNGVIDKGEQCDCGPRYKCNEIDPCCTPRLNVDEYIPKTAVKGCRLLGDAECGSGQPCCSGCKISKEKMVCYSGPGLCDVAICDGVSADCPTGAEASNGMICSQYNVSEMEPLICKDEKCEQGLCSAFDLKPCNCAIGSGKDCSFCCIKDGKCKTAGKDLKLVPNRDFPKPDGAECMGGLCVKGECIQDVHQMVNSSIIPKPPRDWIPSGCCRINLHFAALLAAAILLYT